ncbi:hypothetical protein [Sellimonas intestinalis]|uniref:DUF7666 domain-containing protein n=1 Tax=Sellimonas intestinalis TaxID=1653434 RepID=UPI003990F13C
MSEVIKSYKGFNRDLTCRGKQYEVGKEYEEDRAQSCECGMHACEYPLDCFSYYDPAHSVYYEVEQSGDLSRRGDDSKVASTKMKIGAEINIAGMVKASINYIRERIKEEKGSDDDYGASLATGDYGASSATGYYGASSATGYKGASLATGDYGASSATGYYGASSATGYKGASLATGDYGASSATGYCGASSATGDYGASSATGYKGASLATGDYGASSATGDYGASSATGDYGASSATGDYGASSATGYKGASLATGDYGASSATGNCGASSATGYKGASSAKDPESIAIAWGYKGRVSGVKGSFLVLADWEGDESEYWKPYTWKLKGAKMVRVDGEHIKENTWYTMRNGKIVEVTEDDR